MANQLKYVFRLTHIDNIKYIMSKGLVRASSPLRDENYVSIGDVQVIQVRKDRKYQGYQLSDFMPFYFGPRSPMLYVIQHGYNGVRKVKPEDIVYCIVRIEDIIKNPCYSFAYPYGKFNEKIIDFVRNSGYSNATVVKRGLFEKNDDIFAIKRIGILGTESFFDFLLKISRIRNKL